MKNRLVLSTLSVLLTGCTTAGPFVTDVAYDGEGNLLVMKNTVVFNWFFGTVSTGDKAQTVIVKTPKFSSGLPGSIGTRGDYRMRKDRSGEPIKDADGNFIFEPVPDEK